MLSITKTHHRIPNLKNPVRGIISVIDSTTGRAFQSMGEETKMDVGTHNATAHTVEEMLGAIRAAKVAIGRLHGSSNALRNGNVRRAAEATTWRLEGVQCGEVDITALENATSWLVRELGKVAAKM